MTDEKRQEFLRKAEEFAGRGLRVISVAQRRLTKSSLFNPQRGDIEKDMTFLALAGIFDPPRPETRHAVRACKQGGITVHMLTGDHLTTARAIAEAIEILPRNAPSTAIMGVSDNYFGIPYLHFKARSAHRRQLNSIALPMLKSMHYPNFLLLLHDARRRQKVQ